MDQRYDRPELVVLGGFRDLTHVGANHYGDACTVIGQGGGKAVGNPHCSPGGGGANSRS